MPKASSLNRGWWCVLGTSRTYVRAINVSVCMCGWSGVGLIGAKLLLLCCWATCLATRDRYWGHLAHGGMVCTLFFSCHGYYSILYQYIAYTTMGTSISNTWYILLGTWAVSLCFYAPLFLGGFCAQVDKDWVWGLKHVMYWYYMYVDAVQSASPLKLEW